MGTMYLKTNEGNSGIIVSVDNSLHNLLPLLHQHLDPISYSVHHPYLSQRSQNSNDLVTFYTECEVHLIHSYLLTVEG